MLPQKEQFHSYSPLLRQGCLGRTKWPASQRTTIIFSTNHLLLHIKAGKSMAETTPPSMVSRCISRAFTDQKRNSHVEISLTVPSCHAAWCWIRWCEAWLTSISGNLRWKAKQQTTPQSSVHKTEAGKRKPCMELKTTNSFKEYSKNNPQSCF